MFAGISSLVSYCTFVFVQTVRHRGYFLPEADSQTEEMHAPPPAGAVALASIGLTIPAVAAVSVALGTPLARGLGKEEEMLALTSLVSLMTLGAGRTTVQQGVVHLVILAAFLFLAVVH